MTLDKPGWLSRRLWRRRWQKAKALAAGTPLERYYEHPLPDDDAPLDTISIIAIDFESDGLGTGAALLEAGWTAANSQSVNLASARRERIAPSNPLQETAVTIHRITDSEAVLGRPERMVLDELVGILAGSIILAHCAQIEAGFLDAACQRQYGAPFVGRFICTMQLEERWFPKTRTADGLRLGKLRAQYGLPQYRGHDGLTDAIACGELFLAQLAKRNLPGLTLRDVLLPS